jgi:hypothetical protein
LHNYELFFRSHEEIFEKSKLSADNHKKMCQLQRQSIELKEDRLQALTNVTARLCSSVIGPGNKGVKLECLVLV